MSEADVIAAIIASPDDDIPRVVYADWLEEQGDPRADFVRAQLAMAKAEPRSKAYFDAWAIATPLEREHAEAWASRVPALKNQSYHRGLVRSAAMIASAFVRDNGEVLTHAPVERLRFQRVKDRGAELGACTGLSKLRGLDVAGIKIPEPDLLGLLRSPHLTQLATFVSGNSDQVSPNVLAALLEGPARASLTDLTLGHSGMLDGLPRVTLPKVERLHVGGWWRHGDAQPLAHLGALGFPALTSLSVGSDVNEADIAGLASLPWGQLRALSFVEGSLAPGTLLRLAERHPMPSLESLAIESHYFDETEMDELIEGGAFSSCRSLKLPGGAFTTTTLGSLRALDSLHISGGPAGWFHTIATEAPPLRHLVLHAVQLNDADVEALLAIAPTLRSLTLQHCSVKAANWTTFWDHRFPRLIELHVTNDIYAPDGGMRLPHVAESLAPKRFPALLSLSLNGVSRDREMFDTLTKKLKLPLRAFSYQGNSLHPAQARAFLGAHPTVALLKLGGSLTDAEKRDLAAVPRMKVIHDR